MMYVSQTLSQSFHHVNQIMLFTLNLCSAVCQLHLNKTQRKKKKLAIYDQLDIKAIVHWYCCVPPMCLLR